MAHSEYVGGLCGEGGGGKQMLAFGSERCCCWNQPVIKYITTVARTLVIRLLDLLAFSPIVPRFEFHEPK